MSVCISVENISKKYLIGDVRSASLRESISGKVKQLIAPAKNKLKEFWALQDVSFQVRQGEVMGIIGQNGAGKSTLLKILSRITEPTSGKAEITGRISSLLEVGTGFHPEMTGRENIFMNGAILGMHQAEIKKKFDEIVAFSGIEQFLETPVKRYSSGMYVRLAFAVAAHLEPEILIIDEVLAVGDAEFQKKCMGKMNDAARGGRTVLFVSHNLVAVRSLCQRAIVLQKGKITYSGETEEAISGYLKWRSQTESHRTWSNLEEAPGNQIIRLMKAAAYASGKPETEQIQMSDSLRIEFDFYQYAIPFGLELTMNIYDESGIHVCQNSTILSEPSSPFSEGIHRITADFPPNLFNAKSYVVDMWFRLNKNEVAYYWERVLSFQVEEGIHSMKSGFRKYQGVIHPEPAWKISPLEIR